LKTDVIMLESLFEDIKSDFSSLWTCKQRGESVEIVTPYMDLHSEAIVVYLTKRGNRYIVTDGGRVGSVAEKEEIDLSENPGLVTYMRTPLQAIASPRLPSHLYKRVAADM